jgi:hypothetical protein
VANDEFAYLLDLHLFLGRPFNASQIEAANKDDDFPDGVIGRIPEVLLEEEHSELKVWHDTENDLVSGKKCTYNMRVSQTHLKLECHVGCLPTKHILLL